MHPRTIARTLSLTLLLLATGLAGCFGQELGITVANPHIGDKVTFRAEVTTFDHASVQEVSLHVVDVTTVVLSDGQKRETLRVRVEVSYLDTGSNSTSWFYIDRASLRFVKGTSLCWAGPQSASCSPVSHHYDGRGASWAYGSALLQGRDLQNGVPLRLDETVDGALTPIEVRLEGRAASGDGVEVSLSPADPANRAPRSEHMYYHGRVTIAPGNPYVKAADLSSVRLHPSGSGVMQFHIRVVQTSFTPGDGPELVATAPAPAWTPCGAPTPVWDGILPPGSAYVFPELNLSFKEFVEHLKTAREEFRVHAENPLATLQEVSLRRVSGVEDPLGLISEREDEATIVYPSDNRSSQPFTVTKYTSTQLLPPGDKVQYGVAERESVVTAVPPEAARSPAVPIDSVADRHLRTPLPGSGPSIRGAELRGVPHFDEEGQFAFLQSRLELRHLLPPEPGLPGTFGVFTYDLATGCLITHEPGIRNRPHG